METQQYALKRLPCPRLLTRWGDELMETAPQMLCLAL